MARAGHYAWRIIVLSIIRVLGRIERAVIAAGIALVLMAKSADGIYRGSR